MLEAYSDLGGDILGLCEPGHVGPVKTNVIKTSRKLCLAILLSLLTGHAALTAHEATHIVDDARECLLCISHGAPPAVPAAGSEHVFPNLPYATAAMDSGAPFAPRFLAPYDQRGPPV